MKQIRTKSGFEASVNENAADDMELLDIIADADNGSPSALKRLVRKFLTEDDTARLYEHVRTDDGRVPITAVSAEIVDIMGGLQDGKK